MIKTTGGLNPINLLWILRNTSAAGSETLGKYPRGWILHIYRQGSEEFLFLGGVEFRNPYFFVTGHIYNIFLGY